MEYPPDLIISLGIYLSVTSGMNINKALMIIFPKYVQIKSHEVYLILEKV